MTQFQGERGDEDRGCRLACTQLQCPNPYAHIQQHSSSCCAASLLRRLLARTVIAGEQVFSLKTLTMRALQLVTGEAAD